MESKETIESKENIKKSKIKSMWNRLNKMEKFNVGLIVIIFMYLIFTYTPFFEFVTIYTDAKDTIISANSWCLYEDRIYYANNGALYSCNYDGAKRKLEGSLLYDYNKIFYAYEDKIFFSGNEYGGESAYYDLKSKKCKKIHNEVVSEDDNIFNIKVIDNVMYFVDDNEYLIGYDLKNDKTTNYKFGFNSGKIYKAHNGEMWLYYNPKLSIEGKKVIQTPGENIKCIKEVGEKIYIFTNKSIKTYSQDGKELSSIYLKGDHEVVEYTFDNEVYVYNDDTNEVHRYDIENNSLEYVATANLKNDAKIGVIDDKLIIQTFDYMSDCTILIYDNDECEKTINSKVMETFIDEENKCINYFNRVKCKAEKYEF